MDCLDWPAVRMSILLSSNGPTLKRDIYKAVCLSSDTDNLQMWADEGRGGGFPVCFIFLSRLRFCFHRQTNLEQHGEILLFLNTNTRKDGNLQ